MLPGLLAASLLLAAPAAGAETLSGAYYGIDAADGASLTIEPTEEGYRGTFFDAYGNSQPFEAERNGEVAQTTLQMDGREVLLMVDPVPFGARVTVVPYDAEGKLDVGLGRQLDFVRGELELPEPGPDFVAAPRDARRRITANSFLASYEFWAPEGVRNGYLSLPERFRTLMRLFPAVQLDVIWKLCLAPAADRALAAEADRALAVALRGQGVSCAEVTEGIARAQQSGSFDRFKAEVRAEKAKLRTNVRCADRYPVPKETCDSAARALSEQAVSLETAASVLARYR